MDTIALAKTWIENQRNQKLQGKFQPTPAKVISETSSVKDLYLERERLYDLVGCEAHLADFSVNLAAVRAVEEKLLSAAETYRIRQDSVTAFNVSTKDYALDLINQESDSVEIDVESLAYLLLFMDSHQKTMRNVRDQIARGMWLNYILAEVNKATGCEIDLMESEHGFKMIGSTKMPVTVESLFIEYSDGTDSYITRLSSKDLKALCDQVAKVQGTEVEVQP